jgi:alpha-1,3-rhamnosyl/mannosyltransferase
VLGGLLERAIPLAGRIVAISGRTRDELVVSFPSLSGRVEVIPHGLRSLSVVPSSDRSHVLAFGGHADVRKRTDFMIAVYCAYRDATRDPLPLVVLARAGLSTGQERALAAFGARIVPDATAEEVDVLMGGSAALIYPTLEEGFGLPILEAAEAGTPVVMDRAAAVASEVVGSHCFQVCSDSVDAWVSALRQAVVAAPIEHCLALPPWSSVAERYSSLYAEVGLRS